MHSKGYPMIKSYYTECIISIHKRRSKQTNDNSYVHQILYFKLQEKKILVEAVVTFGVMGKLANSWFTKLKLSKLNLRSLPNAQKSKLIWLSPHQTFQP